MVLLRVQNSRTEIYQADPFLLHILDTEFRYPTSTAHLIARAGPEAVEQSGGWDGWIRLLRQPRSSAPWVPSGLLDRVIYFAQKFGYPVRVEDQRQRPEGDVPDPVRIPLRHYQLEAVERAVERGMGVLDLPPRCHALGELVLMANGECKPAEQICVGDRLLGPDGRSRVVLEVHQGEGQLYRVTPFWSQESFVVNGHHELVLRKHCDRGKQKHKLRWHWEDRVVAVQDFVNWPHNSRRKSYLIYPQTVEFPEGFSGIHRIDPYVLGVLLGDGYFRKTGVCVSTSSVLLQRKLVAEGLRLGCERCRVVPSRTRVPTVVFSRMRGSCQRRGERNPLMLEVERLGLVGCRAGNKFIPWEYKTGSVPSRLALLAGLMDTDGHCTGTSFDYVSKSFQLVQDVMFVARSLGFCASPGKPRVVKGVQYYRCAILGDIARIPTIRRISHHVPKNRDFRNGSFSVEAIGVGEFVGFTVNADNLYLHRDFAVLKNSGKTRVACEVTRRLALPTIWIAPTDRIVAQTQEVLEGFFGKHYSAHLIGSAGALAASRKRIVLATAATASHLPAEFYASRKVIVVDEWHHGGAASYRKIFNMCDHIYHRYGMTGTYFRSGDDDMAMHALISGTIHRATSQDMLRLGHLVPVRAVFLPVDAGRISARSASFFSDHGKHGIHEHSLRNQWAAYAAQALYAVGRKVLILVGTKAQGNILRDMLLPALPAAPQAAEFAAAEFVSTACRRDRQGRILKSFVAGEEVKILIGTSILGEGVDLPAVDALVYAKGEKAEVSLTQAIYRVCTAIEGKREAVLVDFADRHHRKLLAHAQERLRIYYEEPIFRVEVVKDTQAFVAWLANLAR